MKIISSARKLILKPFAGVKATFPEGVNISEYGANNDDPTVVVFNGTDPSWQGVNEEGFVIINEVPEKHALIALDIYGSKSNKTLLRALYYLVSVGCNDQYTTSASFVESKTSPAGPTLENGSGIVKRDDIDMIDVFIRAGVYYVSPGGGERRIEPEILLRTYRNPDGSEICLEEIPEKKRSGVKTSTLVEIPENNKNHTCLGLLLRCFGRFRQ